MKRRNDDRHHLHEEIFAPEEPSNSVSRDEVLDLVRRARQSRDRRRQVSAGAGVVLAVLSWILLRPTASHDHRATVAVSAPGDALTHAAAHPDPISPPTVEKVDDEGMLALLDGTPAAVVRWPDGRRSLLVLVSSSTN